MPDIKLRDGSGVENTYQGVDTITLPLADGSGNWTFGLTDEDLNLSDGNKHYYIFAAGSPLYTEQLMKDNYIINRANFSDIGAEDNLDLRGLFYMNTYIEDLSNITFNWSHNGIQFSDLFNSCPNLKRIPNFSGPIKSINANQSNGIFNHCYTLEQSQMPKVYHLINLFNGTPQTAIMTSCYGITEINGNEIQGYFNSWNNSYTGYNRFFSQMYNLRTYILPVNTKAEFTSSSYPLDNSIPYSYMLSDLEFVTQENNVPYNAKMKSQSFYVTGYNSSGHGWYNTDSLSNEFYKYSGVNKTHNIFDGLTSTESKDLPTVQARYNEVKQYDDWHSISTSTITYEGKSNVQIARLFSRFNHDSIVKFFNTLPDTSAYLQEKGGTNTLKLLRFQGDLTDQGGVSDLTEAEIQVATDKGWTVTVVDS